MKPDFALSLSFEGISLLYRIEGGWHLMGEAALTSETLGADLEALRDMAEAIGGKAFRTKLVLPNEQIKYLSLTTGKCSPEDRNAAIAQELEATTPYRVDELAFDLHPAGAETRAAAVAQETLAEAEAFAVDHAFNPVCFVAIPPDGAFSGEPFFGATKAAEKLLKKDRAEADELPIHVISSGPLPAPKPTPAPEQTPPTPKDAAAPKTTPKSGPEAAPETNLKAPVIAPPDGPSPDGPSKTPPAPKAARETPDTKAPEIKTPAAKPPATKTPVADPTPSFESRRSADTALIAERAASQPGSERASTLTASREDETALRFDPARIAAGMRPQDTRDTAEPKTNSRRTAILETVTSAIKSATGALTRQRLPGKAAATPPNKSTDAPSTERQRMMVFGARAGEIGGKPRYLGLALTMVLLLFLTAVAIWAALFLEDGVAGLLRNDPPAQIADTAPESRPVDEMETAALPPTSPDTITDSAEIEAMTDETHPSALDSHQAEARYAATGIWQRAPDPSPSPLSGSTDDLYLTSIDRVVIAKDAVALPSLTSYTTDTALPRQMSPLPAGLQFDLDDRGLVKATPKGALSPDGILVYQGRPPAVPPSYPVRTASPDALPAELRAQIAKLRPRLRPTDLIEQNERAANNGRSLAELGKMRPRLRPQTAKAAEEAEDITATQYAVAASLRPKARPSNFETIVARAEKAERTAPTAALATVAPSIPSKASVARQATIQNAMNLRKINLIGVYGTSSSRRALVRLSNGRFKKVKVGDRIDGGKVAAIDDTELRYVKSGKNVVLKLPRG